LGRIIISLLPITTTLILKFDIFSQFPEITQFSTTRQGGVSRGNYASFNLSPYVDDVPEHWFSNLEILKKKLNINELVFPYQSHGNEVLIVDNEFCQKSPAFKTKALTEIDALITNNSELCIAVTTADCVPVMFYDAVGKVIAVAHAGWRGTYSCITQKTVQSMCENFGSRPNDIHALIGPSISVDVYNVGNEVFEAFKSANFPLDRIFRNVNELLHLDLWEANRWLLEQSGIPEQQIQVAGMCTFTEDDQFFSARKSGIKCGRMMNGMVMRNL